ncbi:MAG TPA: protein-glutamate O-methyltransferase CheR [Chloroflexota bacterium]|nr:protein-glutamate O-methyltransferase CheR [Chloroflexota bacterium]
MPRPEQFERIQRLALQLAGIELFERHREVVDRKCRRLGIQEASGLDALLDAADEGDANARRRLIGLLTTNFTGFFRHPHQLDLAAEHALWAVHRRGTARLWSAAAATGEEPYSLAMATIDVFRRDDPAVTILATDIDDDALAVARRGEYGEPALSTLAAEHRTRFFNRAAESGRWRIAQAARDLVEFRALNLTGVEWHLAGPFDVVFCRNVLLYLEAGHRYSVLERIASLLAPDGILLLDPAEHLGRAGHLFVTRTNGLYSRRPPSHTRGGPRAIGHTPG